MTGLLARRSVAAGTESRYGGNGDAKTTIVGFLRVSICAVTVLVAGGAASAARQ